MRPIRIATAVVMTLALFLPVGSAASSHDNSSNGNGSTRIDQSLRALAARHDLRIGTAVDMNAYANDTVYRDRIATEFSAVTAENVMKWDTIEPVRGQLNFAPADELVNFARRNGQKVRGHTLLWHNQLPGWLTSGVSSGEITPAELRDILRRHIFEVVTHFKGRIWHWDVVNEVIDDNGNLRDTLWLQNLGPGYIADSFRWAHQADPRVELYLNDYNVEGPSVKSDAYFALAQQLKAQRVPVDGFGVQGHLGVQFGFYSAPQMQTNLKRFEDLGLEISITEADVRMILPVDNPKLQGQAQGYTILMQACLLARRCTSFIVWGYTDKYSWVPGFFTGQGAANLLDENFQPKPAYDAVRTTLALAGNR
jgi:endo-1,4-beta-xylanase